MAPFEGNNVTISDVWKTVAGKFVDLRIKSADKQYLRIYLKYELEPALEIIYGVTSFARYLTTSLIQESKLGYYIVNNNLQNVLIFVMLNIDNNIICYNIIDQTQW